MIPVRRFGVCSSHLRESASPVFCRRCGKWLKISRGQPFNQFALCGKCQAANVIVRRRFRDPSRNHHRKIT